jgi:hypothetical protein
VKNSGHWTAKSFYFLQRRSWPDWDGQYEWLGVATLIAAPHNGKSTTESGYPI